VAHRRTSRSYGSIRLYLPWSRRDGCGWTTVPNCMLYPLLGQLPSDPFLVSLTTLTALQQWTIYRQPVSTAWFCVFLLEIYPVRPDDIMRARIQTMGIAEHEFEISLGPKVVKWLLYDVGGARGQVCRKRFVCTSVRLSCRFAPTASFVGVIF
jgi:hypothetical protein